MYKIYSIFTDPDTGDQTITLIGEIECKSWTQTILHLLSVNDDEPNREYFSDPLLGWDMM